MGWKEKQWPPMIVIQVPMQWSIFSRLSIDTQSSCKNCLMKGVKRRCWRRRKILKSIMREKLVTYAMER